MMTEAQRRNVIKVEELSLVKETSGSSLSTEGSSSPRYFEARSQKINKEKLELCKKFTEFGYCPYQKKCKFAHGYHELRKDNTANSKYKTKECVTYIKNGFCHYGSRCNFIHCPQDSEQVTLHRPNLRGYIEIFQCAKNKSRVLFQFKD